MKDQVIAQPLPRKNRKRTFRLLLLIFLVSIPFLYLYATGYRIDFKKPTNLVSTGGIYIAVDDENETEIYIDDKPEKGTRTFRNAFYIQNLDAGTHRVHIQSEGDHTWVKELPVYKHLVTEAQAFNLPLAANVRVVSEFETATGTQVFYEPIGVKASTTNEFLLATTTIKENPDFVLNNEYEDLMIHFASSTAVVASEMDQTILDLLTGDDNATTTDDIEEATSTVMTDRAKLYEKDGELYATWTGSFEQMPYYYCAEDFPPYSTSTASSTDDVGFDIIQQTEAVEETINVMHPVQSVPEDTECDPTIRIDRKGQEFSDFDFFQDNTDLVIIALEDGVYVVEVDDRSWQNTQPLLLGEGLKMYAEGDRVYVYDGMFIYEVIIEPE